MPGFTQKVRWPIWIHLLLLVGVGLSVHGGLAGLRDEDPVPFAYVPFGVALVLAAVWWRMRFLYVEFGPEGAAFGFGGPRRRVPRERISTAVVERYRAARYLGWGYRLGWGRGDRAYSVIGYRRGVRLVFEDDRGTWSIFISCEDPEAAVAALGLKA